MKTAIFAVSLSCLFSLMVLSAMPAIAMECPQLFQSKVTPRPASVEAVAAELIAKKWDGVTDRGFVSGFPEATGALSAAVAKEGLLWWYIRIFVVPSIEAAKAHSALEKDPLMQGAYLINSGKTAEETAALTAQPAGVVFKQMLAKDKMYFFRVKENGVTEIVPAHLIEKNLRPENMTWDLNDPEHGPYIRENGWAFPRYRGVIQQASTEGSKTYAKMRALARKLVKDGFRITFTKDFVRALNMVRDQKRLIEGRWESNSLYAGENNANYKSTLESYYAGRAFSVEVWNEKGEMVGGLIGFRDGSVFSPESAFYDNARYPQISIGFAKVAAVALMDRLHAAGIPFADAGMVSPFTESMRGELTSATNFLTMVANLPPNVEVDLKTDWIPPIHAEH